MGRPAGVPNKASGAVREMAQLYGPDGIRRLADLAGLGSPGLKAESEMAQISAIKELLDRAYGKAAQPLTGEDGGALQIIIETGVPRPNET